MSNEAKTELDRLIERLRDGDDSALGPLLERADGRLRGMASQILGDFPRLRKEGGWQTDDVTSEAQIRLVQSLREIVVTDKQHFFRLAAKKIRWFLLDEVRRLPKSDRPDQALLSPGQAAGRGHDYQELVSMLLEVLAGLPEEQYAIIDLEFILGFSDKEIATELKVDESTVRRRRRRAYEAIALKLGDAFPGLREGLA